MSTQRCLLGTVVGGVVLFFLGYGLYGVLLASFFEANMGSATGVNRETIDFVALGIGQLMWGGVLTVLVGWKKAASAVEGLRVGVIAGLLFFLGFDLTLYASTNISNLTSALADVVVATILFGITGAIVAVVVGQEA